jgi:hypothetical protein
MSTHVIFEKYWDALVTTADSTLVLSQPAVRLALRLAIGDAYDAGAAVAADLVAIVAEQALPERSLADQRYAEQLQAQISRLNEWLAEEEPALYRSPCTDTAGAVLDAIKRRDVDLTNAYHDLQAAASETSGLRQQLAQMDADNADLAQRLSNRETVLAADRERLKLALSDADKAHKANAMLQAEIDRLTRQNAIATDTFNSLSEAHTNGVDPTPASPSADWGRNHPAWEALPAADLAVIDQISSGLITFRRTSKTLRRDLVVRVIRHLASQYGGTISSGEWDRHRPDWMPTQGAVIMLSDGENWTSLLAMAIEPTPA